MWVGNAANNAAKMAALDPKYPTYNTAEVYGRLNDSSKYGQGGRNMWTDLGTADVGDRIYGSTWWWSAKSQSEWPPSCCSEARERDGKGMTLEDELETYVDNVFTE